MKKKSIIWLTIFFFLKIYSQEVKYTVLQDNPEKYLPKLNINLDVMQMDASFNNILGISFNAGVWGSYNLKEKIGVQFSVNKSYLSLIKLTNKAAKGNLEFQAGFVFLPLKNTKIRKTNVVLSRKRTDKVETIKSINVNATSLNYKGFKAGIISKSSGFDLYDLAKKYLFQEAVVNYTSVAMYAGIMSRKLKTIVLDVEGYGKRGNSSCDEFFIDVTVNVVNKFNVLPLSSSLFTPPTEKDIKNAVKASPLGFRIGWNRYQIAPKSVTDKKFGGSGHFEAGWRPYLGWYIGGSIGLTLIKK